MGSNSNGSLSFSRIQNHRTANSNFISWIVTVMSRLDLVAAAALSSLLVYLAISLASALIRRRRSRLRELGKKDTSWQFNSAGSQLTRSCHRDIMGSSFQSKMGMANYYGDSNGDSEHDMIQSCSQSSHYEEFGPQNQRQLMMQVQPLYFNAPSSATSRRPIKSSLSVSSAGESGSTTGSRRGTTIFGRYNEAPRAGQMSSMKEFAGKPDVITNNCGGGETAIDDELILASNQIPLVNSSQASQINLDHRGTKGHSGVYQSRILRDQPNFASHLATGKRGEHIYDDIAYNQMIL